MSEIDRDRLIKLLGMTGSSHDGEALSALRRALDLLAAAGVTWDDLLHGPGGELEVATQAAAQLLAENTALSDEIERLRSLLGCDDVDEEWRSLEDFAGRACWCLTLQRAGKIRFSELDRDFLDAVMHWEGELPTEHQRVLQQVLRDVHRRTGLRPSS
jgi:hypothetical protein